jgi:hypothetical protein
VAVVANFAGNRYRAVVVYLRQSVTCASSTVSTSVGEGRRARRRAPRRGTAPSARRRVPPARTCHRRRHPPGRPPGGARPTSPPPTSTSALPATYRAATSSPGFGARGSGLSAAYVNPVHTRLHRAPRIPDKRRKIARSPAALVIPSTDGER